MKLYLIRHGETEWNVLRRLQGRADIPLNENGKELAEKTGKALAGVPFTRIYSSPLKRAFETAQYIRGDRELEIIKEERLQEISFGDFEGLSCSKDHYTIPDPHFMDFFEHPDRYVAPKGGESIPEMCKRTTSFLRELVEDRSLENDTILLSTHGAAMMGLLSTVHQCELENFWNGGVHKNCAVTILDVTDGKIEIVEENKVFVDDTIS